MVLDVQDGLVYELSVTAFVDADAVADFIQVLLQVFDAGLQGASGRHLFKFFDGILKYILKVNSGLA